MPFAYVGGKWHVSGVNFESHGMTANEGKEKRKTENKRITQGWSFQSTQLLRLARHAKTETVKVR